MQNVRSKVAIIGTGSVGSSFAYALMISGSAREISMIDMDAKRAKGESMDLNHGASFVQPVKVASGGYEECEGASIVVITAGAKQAPGETRIDLVQRNTEIFKSIIPKISKYAKDAIFLIVTNPVDILTYATLKISDFPVSRVIGSGTVLDSSRLRYLISEHCRVDPRNVHAYILGEHGDTELPVWSRANIGGIALDKYCLACGKHCDYKMEFDKIFKEVKNAAYKIIEAKGSTYYAVGLALVKIVESILRDENSVLPVSTLINGYYGINDVCLSIPSVVNARGAERFLNLELSDIEQKQLKHSVETLKDIIRKIKL
ncbi:MAG: L-lactate dehydrogenase [Candidatus Omnitrophica bacterium CG07_land_8_20_14_0_80_42_15]|uniref:L-lactate dehydrogenase n=1 Tax=Candidatus Aquitaenariimonas noxiae TaxID=1974741 RepID=A0A2J0KQI4_9BACT|nr:MAG: L-lactate dehydrogenase [Candidatus Omnitrophica bacterium CG07_land_8_20_14_0_80_42_15]